MMIISFKDQPGFAETLDCVHHQRGSNARAPMCWQILALGVVEKSGKGKEASKRLKGSEGFALKKVTKSTIATSPPSALRSLFPVMVRRHAHTSLGGREAKLGPGG